MLSRTAITALLTTTVSHASFFYMGKRRAEGETKQDIINATKDQLTYSIPITTLLSFGTALSEMGFLVGPIIMTPILSHFLIYNYGKYQGMSEIEEMENNIDFVKNN